MNIKFEKFYLIDYRGINGKIFLKFIHHTNNKKINLPTHEIIKILQSGEIQVQTQFCNEKFCQLFAKNRYRNLRNIKSGDPINVYYIPVILSDNQKFYSFNSKNNI